MNISYINQINNAINYIINHLEEELDVQEIAKHCNFSKYYFNRLFKSVVGESVYSFVKRLRIEKSALLLKVAPDKSVTEIGAKFSYSSSNYSSAFKQHYNYSPVQFRKLISEKGLLGNGSLYNDYFEHKDFLYYEDRIKYIELPRLKVVYERYIGNYVETSKNWGGFLEKSKSLITDDAMLLDISHDDPAVTNEDRCIYDICISIDNDIPGFSSMTLDGGKYVSYEFEGPASRIFEAYQGILGAWLPNSDVTLDDRRIISIYDKRDQRVDCMKMDICIPIK